MGMMHKISPKDFKLDRIDLNNKAAQKAAFLFDDSFDLV